MTSEISQAEVAFYQGVNTEMVMASGKILFAAQVGNLATNTEAKPDKSLVSDDDRNAEKLAKKVWRSRTDQPILGEESGVSFDLAGATVLGMDDPIDGTRPRTNGAHSSVTMAGAYDLRAKEFIASSLWHPVSGTLVEASNGHTSVTHFNAVGGQQQYDGQVWEGSLRGSTVLVDNLAPFSRGDHQEREITNKVRIGKFIGGIIDLGAVPQCYGSNGYHQILLAKGGEKLSGAVMLSQGGPWDAVGLLAVLNSGGAAKAFQVADLGRIEERDPHDPFNWDILVLANSKENANSISGVVERMYA